MRKGLVLNSKKKKTLLLTTMVMLPSNYGKATKESRCHVCRSLLRMAPLLTSPAVHGAGGLIRDRR